MKRYTPRMLWATLMASALTASSQAGGLETCATFDFGDPAGDLSRFTLFKEGALAADWITSDDPACVQGGGNFTGGDGVAACSDPMTFGMLGTAYLCSPAIDLTRAENPQIEALVNFDARVAGDELELLIGSEPPGLDTIDGYASIRSWTGDVGVPFESGELIIEPVVPQYGYICLKHSDAGSMGYAQIDDLAVRATTCACDPYATPDECPETQWRCIGELKGESPDPSVCDLSGTSLFEFWIGGQLFPPIDPLGLSIDSPVTRPYCLFQVRTNQPNGLPISPRTTNCQDVQDELTIEVAVVEPDLYVSAPTAELADLVAPELQTHFLEQAGKPSTPLPVLGTARARLAVVDSVNQQPGDPLVGAHGNAITEMAVDLLCEDIGFPDPCPVEITNGLGLPMICFVEEACLNECGETDGCPGTAFPEFSDGPFDAGFKGTPATVGEAIRDVLGAWLVDVFPDLLEQRLVVNLSLGWNSIYNQRLEGTRNAFAALVAQMQEASCLGVIFVASSGNEIPGPALDDGPLSPANLNQLPAPTFTQCQDLLAPSLAALLDPADFPPPGDPRPLVYAVGAVDQIGAPVIQKSNSQPSLVAYGDHGVGQLTNGGSYSEILTGSSVASVVVASAAAAAWAYAPSLPPHQLMDLIYASGEDLGMFADFCLGADRDELGRCPSVQRVSVCNAITATCEAAPGQCPPIGNFVCTGPFPTQAPLDPLAGQLSPLAVVSIPSLTEVTVIDDGTCGAADYTLHSLPADDSSVSDPCPHITLPADLLEPWSGPEPEGQSCESCSGQSRSPLDFYLEIQARRIDAPLTSATLVCEPRDGSAVMAYRLPLDFDGAPPIESGNQYEVLDVPEEFCLGADIDTYLTFAIDGENRSLEQLLLLNGSDGELDGVPDYRDNCQLSANVDQRDADGDGFGSLCDGDLNNDCTVNGFDFRILRALALLGSNNAVADLNGDGIVNVVDLQLFLPLFGSPPGPTGLPNDCEDQAVSAVNR